MGIRRKRLSDSQKAKIKELLETETPKAVYKRYQSTSSQISLSEIYQIRRGKTDKVQAASRTGEDWRAKELVKHIVNGNIAVGTATINSVNSDELDLKQFNRQVVEYLRGLLLIKTGSEAVNLAAEDIPDLKDLAARASADQLLKAVKLFGQLEPGLSFNSYSTLPLELALAECALTSGEKKEVLAAETGPRPVEVTCPPAKANALSILHKLVDSLKEFPGEDEVWFSVISDEAVVDLKLDTRTNYCPELHRRLVELVGEDGLTRDVKSVCITMHEPQMSEVSHTAPPLRRELERLKLHWRHGFDQVPKNVRRTPAVAILRSVVVKPMAIEAGDTVVLVFRYAVYKEKMEEPENKRIAEEIIGNFLGHPCRVRCMVDTEYGYLLRALLEMVIRSHT